MMYYVSVSDSQGDTKWYYVRSKANYDTAVGSLIYPRGFEDYEGNMMSQCDYNC